MQEFKLIKGVLSTDLNNRFVTSDIIDKNGNLIKKIKVFVGYKYIHFELGKEYLDNSEKLYSWCLEKTEDIFQQFKVAPAKFKQELIEIFFIV